jgi:ElaB/YqjD/DUF883 family membrane-anchored ribosome-binding protein
MEGEGSKPANEALGNSVNRRVDDVTASAHEKVDQTSDAVQPVVDRVASNAHAAIDTVADAAVAAADTLGTHGEQLTNVQARLMEAAREYMREQPIAALGIAVAAGWILSRLLRA